MANAVDELRKQIVEQIKEAFKDVEQPIGHTLSSDRGSLGRMLKEHWSNVSVETLTENYHLLSVLRADFEIFIHYLPAYLIHALEHSDSDPTASSMMSVVCALDPTYLVGTQKELEREALFRFTPKQAKAILVFLEALDRLFPEEMALRRPPPEFTQEIDRILAEMGMSIPLLPSERLPKLLTHWRAMADRDKGAKVSPIQLDDG